ncbi:hypothetical protein AAVH_27532, partial [Aphelenchoides avenae]
ASYWHKGFSGPLFALIEEMRTMLIANGKQIELMKMNCKNMFPKCGDSDSPMVQLKGNGDEDCVWCARNGTEGYSILFEERHHCEGVIIVDVCAPYIIKVSRDGSVYHIDGNHFLSFQTNGYDFPIPSVTVCGEDCIYANADWKDTSIKCVTKKSSFFQRAFCNSIMIRGKIAGSFNAFVARSDRQAAGNSSLSMFSKRKILDRYYEYDNGMLTLVHDFEGITAMVKQI